jgi:hypothetical protein
MRARLSANGWPQIIITLVPVQCCWVPILFYLIKKRKEKKRKEKEEKKKKEKKRKKKVT